MQMRHHLSARRAFHVTAAVLPMLAACASARPFTAANESAGHDVLRVSADHAGGARIVLSGAPVELVSRTTHGRQDTVYTSAPFAVTLPADAFELQVAVRDGNGRETNADVELSIPDAAGAARVRATGPRLVLRRAAPGAAIEVAGSVRPVEVARVPRDG